MKLDKGRRGQNPFWCADQMDLSDLDLLLYQSELTNATFLFNCQTTDTILKHH